MHVCVRACAKQTTILKHLVSSAVADIHHNTHLGGHDQLVVDDVVRGEAHTKQCAGRVQVARHACPGVHVLPQPLSDESSRRIKCHC